MVLFSTCKFVFFMLLRHCNYLLMSSLTNFVITFPNISINLLTLFQIIILRSQAHHWKASRSAQKRVSRENKTLTTTILICSSFFIGWAPATIHFTITCDTCELLKEQKFRVLFFFSCIQLSFILGKSLLNPLIYSIRIPEIEQQLEAMKDKYWAPIRRTIW